MTYPQIDPVALDFGVIQIHWYGIMYLLAFVSAYLLAKSRAQIYQWKTRDVEDLIFYGAFGVIIGGRVGYMVFYHPGLLISDPLLLFKVWQGGMSFHGGFLGVLLAMAIFANKRKKTFFTIMDFVAPLVPLGLGFGRIANFINSELWGKETTSPFGMYAPNEFGIWVTRYPSQLYEALLEGLVLFIILWVYSAKPRSRMRVSALFLVGYGSFRFLVEFVRTPDAHLGYLAWGWLTMGQVLSLPMIIFGVFLWLSSTPYNDSFRRY